MSEISNAIKQICAEKGLSYDAVLVTIEAALAAAYRKDFGNRMQNIKVEFDPETAHIKAYDVKTVVEDLTEEELKAEEEARAKMAERAEEAREGKPKRKAREEEKPVEPEVKPVEGTGAENTETAEEVRKFNPKTEIQLKDALMLKKDAVLGEEIRMELEVPGEFGRMAAQTAKQVIIQKLREAERDMVYGEFKDKEKEVVSGVVQRREGRVVLVDLGKAIGILPQEEQIYGENYRAGQRIKIYVREVKMGPRGAEIILSRTSEEILRKVFYLEIPEIANGLIEIKAVAREAGSRSKVAVATEAENVDPIGSCVGQRGSRIQTIISELGGEKVDIIEYDSAPEKFIANALSPAKIVSIRVDSEGKRATVSVNADQFSLAIGKSGQNVRLAAHLTGWKIDIEESKKAKEEPAPSDSLADESAGEEAEGEKAETMESGEGMDVEANEKAETAKKTEEKAEAVEKSEEGATPEKKEKPASPADKPKKKASKKKKESTPLEAAADKETEE